MGEHFDKIGKTHWRLRIDFQISMHVNTESVGDIQLQYAIVGWSVDGGLARKEPAICQSEIIFNFCLRLIIPFPSGRKII